MRWSSTLAALLALVASTVAAGEPVSDGLGHEARVYAADVVGRSTLPPAGEARESSTEPFSKESTLAAAGGAEGVRTELAGGTGATRSRVVVDRVVLALPGNVVEARGVESRALAQCAGSTGSASVRSILVNGAPLEAVRPGTRVPLANGLTLLVDEQSSSRTMAGVAHATAALRVRDAAGESVAAVGFAEAKLTGCLAETPGVCEGFLPALAGAARVKDAGAPGKEIALTAANATGPGHGESAAFSWMRGVPTLTNVTFSPQVSKATMTVRGTSRVVTSYGPGSPPVEAIVVQVHARHGSALVEDLTLDGVRLASRLTGGGVDAVTIEGYTLPGGFALDAVATLSWDDLPSDPDALGLDVRLGRCAT